MRKKNNSKVISMVLAASMVFTGSGVVSTTAFAAETPTPVVTSAQMPAITATGVATTATDASMAAVTTTGTAVTTTPETITIPSENESNATIKRIFDPVTGCLTITGSGFLGTKEIECHEGGIKYFSSYFENMGKVRKVVISDGITGIGVGEFGKMPYLQEVEIPDSVKEIYPYAFDSCKNLKSVTLGNGVTSIGREAFYACEKLTDFTIGTALTSVDTLFLGKCPSLKKITVAEGNKSFKIVNDGLYSADGTVLYAYPNASETVATIAEGTKEISDLTFAENKMSEIKIPASVEKIGGGAFYNCAGLSNVQYAADSKLKRIEEYYKNYGDEYVDAFGAFEKCTKITSMKFPNSFEVLAGSTFRGCTGLKSLSFGTNFKGFSNIYEKAIRSFITIADSCRYNEENGMPAFTTVSVASSNAKFASSNGVLLSKSKKTICLYPEGKTTASYTVPSTVTTIGVNAFQQNNKIKKVTFGKNVTTVKSDAFAFCSNLNTLNMNAKLKTIELRAFRDCTKLATVKWSKKISSFGTLAFYNCKALKNIVFSGSSVKVKSYAFEGCKKVTKVTWPKSFKEVGSNAFKGCSGIKNVTLAGKNLVIKSYAFINCKALSSVTIKSGVKEVGDEVFTNSTKLKKVTIPSTVKKIGYRAFGYQKDGTVKVKGFKIYGKKNSAAQKYAKANKISFVKK